MMTNGLNLQNENYDLSNIYCDSKVFEAIEDKTLFFQEMLFFPI